MAAKHTPGPWRLCGAFGMQGLIEPAAGGNPVAAVTGYYHHAGHTEANARLIAAAPDLLETLQDLVLNINEAMGTGGWVPTPLHASFWAAVSDGHAAIAKATGAAA